MAKTNGGAVGYARYAAICPPEWGPGVTMKEVPSAPLPEHDHPLRRNEHGVMRPTPPDSPNCRALRIVTGKQPSQNTSPNFPASHWGRVGELKGSGGSISLGRWMTREREEKQSPGFVTYPSGHTPYPNGSGMPYNSSPVFCLSSNKVTFTGEGKSRRLEDQVDGSLLTDVLLAEDGYEICPPRPELLPRS